MTDAKGNYVLAHLSDLHLGYRSGRETTVDGVNWREQDGYTAFTRMVDQIIRDGTVDAVLVAGDVFHVPNPSTRAVFNAQREYRRLADAGIPVYSLTGNHDVNDIRSDMASTVLLDDPDRGIHSHCEPYVTHKLGDGIVLHMVSHHLYREQADTWEQVKPVDGCINIFSTHGSLVDPLTELALHTNQSPREVIIPDELLNNPDWSYRLLGHIHERGFVGTKDGKRDSMNLRTYYNGSLIRRGFSDGETPLGRGWTKWTITPDGTFTPTFYRIRQRPQVDFPVIDASTLSPTEITGIILDNLRSAFPDDNTAPDRAPILRQKITNITPEKKRSLDNTAISNTAEPALIWTLNMRQDNVDADVDDGHAHLTGINTTGNLTETYDGWLNDSQAYNDLHDTIREQVAKETKQFIKQGQDTVLDNEQ